MSMDLLVSRVESKLAGEVTVAQTVKAVFEALKDLQDGEKVVIRGFGSFEPRTRAARVGRNPSNGEPVQIPAKRVLRAKIIAKI